MTNLTFLITYLTSIALGIAWGAWTGWDAGFKKGKQYYKTNFDFESKNTQS